MTTKVKTLYNHIYAIVKHGKWHTGRNKKPIWWAGCEWYDGYHVVIHIGYFYLGVSY